MVNCGFGAVTIAQAHRHGFDQKGQWIALTLLVTLKALF